ncbi:hypothetical protein GG344DRAFT_71587 [Lentinula edodes]|nr:hypothetical protein GG344DRAFT_71587 [Lentinula edodes]
MCYRSVDERAMHARTESPSKGGLRPGSDLTIRMRYLHFQVAIRVKCFASSIRNVVGSEGLFVCFAPNIILDRSGTKVRYWRIAKREIRGIGGGRWFAQGWVVIGNNNLGTRKVAEASRRRRVTGGSVIDDGDQVAFASQAEAHPELRKSIGNSPLHVEPLKMSSVSAPV